MMRKVWVGMSTLMMIIFMSSCGITEKESNEATEEIEENVIKETVVENDADEESQIGESAPTENETEENVEDNVSDDSNENHELVNTELPDTEYTEAIIYSSEVEVWHSLPDDGRTGEAMAELETVPDSSVTYVAVDGYGNAVGMGIPFQQYAVGVRANPIEGYRYAGCESDTIEFFMYDPNEALGYDVPWFHVPDSGHHVIYVYFEPIE